MYKLIIYKECDAEAPETVLKIRTSRRKRMIRRRLAPFVVSVMRRYIDDEFCDLGRII